MYAGQVVDTAATYGEFVRDRQERLDRYALAHGPHWLWWEPPLNMHPEAQPKAMGSVALIEMTTSPIWDLTTFYKDTGSALAG
jgi:hypothetical protein